MPSTSPIPDAMQAAEAIPSAAGVITREYLGAPVTHKKLSGRFRDEGFGSFVMGAPVEGELEARIEKLVAEIVNIRAHLRSSPPRVVPGDDRERADLARTQADRKVVK